MPDSDSETQAESGQTSQSPVRNLSEVARAMFKLAFERASTSAGGERLLWDVFPIGMPNPMQPGQMITGLGIFMSISGPMLGTTHMLTTGVDCTIAEQDQETIDTFARDRLGELLNSRAQQVQDLKNQSVAGNGQPAREPASPPSDLIIPR